MECKAVITTTSSSASVDCSGCRRGPDLSHNRCFIGIARSLVPGFSGELVIKGRMDRSYSGPLVEALSSTSEVLGMIDALNGDPAQNGLGLMSRLKARGRIKRIWTAFVEDPERFLEEGESFREDLSRSLGEDGAALVKRLDDILDRTGLMVRKLRANVDGP